MRLGKCPRCGRFGMKSKRHYGFGKRYYTYTCIYCGYTKIRKRLII